MKKKFYLLAWMLCTAPLFAQDFTYIYEPTESSDYIVIRDVYKTSDGNILAGYDLMSGSMPTAGIMKTDNDGAVIWSKTLNIPVSLAGCTFEVAERANGNFYLWGLSKEDITNNMRAILCEITPSGEMVWAKEYDFGFNATAAYTINKLQVMPSGDLQMMIAVYGEVIVLKTDADGTLIWGKQSAMGPPDEGGKNPGFEWLAIPDDGGMCASKAGNNFSLLRYNNDGELMWNKAYSLGTYTHGKTICKSTNGNILVAGFIDYVPHIMELDDEDGTLNWVKTFDGVTLPFLGKAHLTVVNEKIILDFTNSESQQYILEMSETGEVLKTMMTNYAIMDYNKLEFTAANEEYFYGSMFNGIAHSGMIHRTADVFTESCMIRELDVNLTTSVFEDYAEVDFTPYESEFVNEEPIEITLSDLQLRTKFACGVYLSDGKENAETIAVYPNPSAEMVTISVPADWVHANYTLTDLSGKVVLSGLVISNPMLLDLSALSKGQYVLALATGNNVMTEKITVIR